MYINKLFYRFPRALMSNSVLFAFIRNNKTQNGLKLAQVFVSGNNHGLNPDFNIIMHQSIPAVPISPPPPGQ